jgi:putative ABC transport system ATP-binding protein
MRTKLNNNMSLIQAKNINKIFRRGQGRVEALRDISISISEAEFVAIMGPSGSGKSTLMHILGCLDRPTSGSYYLDGQDISLCNDIQLSRIRASQIGFVFQTFNLIPQLNVLENVKLPYLYRDDGEQLAHSRALGAIEKVGLVERMLHRPSELSGGELQRAAIARALSINPSMILADEPTGNLDSRTGKGIIDLFLQLNSQGATVVMVTHNEDIATNAQRVLHIRDGMISTE